MEQVSVCEGRRSVAGFLQLVNLQGAETASSSAPSACVTLQERTNGRICLMQPHLGGSVRVNGGLGTRDRDSLHIMGQGTGNPVLRTSTALLGKADGCVCCQV